MPDPQETVKRNHEHAAAILAGLDAMVNKHQDPQSVYDQYLKPHGITEEEWGVQSISGQTEEGKKSIAEFAEHDRGRVGPGAEKLRLVSTKPGTRK